MSGDIQSNRKEHHRRGCAQQQRTFNEGRTADRQWAELLATNGQFRDRLRAGSHGRRQKPETESRDTSVAQRRRPTGDAKAARCMPRHDDRLCGKRFSLWRWSPLAEARADVTADAVVPRDQGGAIPAGLGTVHPDPQESGSYAGGVVTRLFAFQGGVMVSSRSQLGLPA